jgi:flavorubredoxin
MIHDKNLRRVNPMKARKIVENVYWLGAIDWDRRLFDALIPLPDGTSYNAYLVRGSEKTVLLDTVDPEKADMLMSQLANIPQLDYVIAHHAEQDHAGSIPQVLEKYPGAQVLATPKGKSMLVDHLGIPADRVIEVSDGETLELGGKPWSSFMPRGYIGQKRCHPIFKKTKFCSAVISLAHIWRRAICL